MKVLGLYIAESVIIDQRTNKLSLINLLENLDSDGFPLFFTGFNVVLLCERVITESENQTVHFVISINNKNIFEIDTAMNFMEKGLRTRCILTLNGLVLPEPGLLTISALINGTEIAKVSNDIHLRMPK